MQQVLGAPAPEKRARAGWRKRAAADAQRRGPRRVLIVTDAWRPQVNGVVRTLERVAGELAGLGHVVDVIGPDRFATLPCPTYPEIRLAVMPGQRLAALIEAFAPDSLHIATEGPLGTAARRWAKRQGLRFTTSFQTRFAEYVTARTFIPADWLYPLLRRFHAAGASTMVATDSLREELRGRGFTNLVPWSRGVDLELFRPAPCPAFADLPRPVFVYVGRVAVEKNIEAFLALDLPGTKVVVGDGPQLAALRQRFAAARFLGAKFGAELAACYAGADVFVFPSLTDTFGLVLLEALACGTPIAAFDVTGPKDIVAKARGRIGAIGGDLRAAALSALGADRGDCRRHAETYSWRSCAESFLRHLVPLRA